MLRKGWVVSILFMQLVSPALAGGGLDLSSLKGQLLDSSFVGKALEDYTGQPYHSTIELKGKINLGSTAYYSVTPELTMNLKEQIVGPWGQSLYSLYANLNPTEKAALEQELQGKDIFAFGVRPQYKANEAQGYSIYFHLYTGHPKLMEAFKQLSQAKFTMPDLIITYTQSGPGQKLFSKTPAAGSTVTKPLSPFQPK